MTKLAEYMVEKENVLKVSKFRPAMTRHFNTHTVHFLRLANGEKKVKKGYD